MDTFETTNLNRVLAWDGISNTRDMGGYPLREGEQMRWKAIVRSETLCLLTPQGQQDLVDYGIRTVIDLRFPYELENWPNPFAYRPPAGDETVDYIHISLDKDVDFVWSEGMDQAESMSEMYCGILEENRVFAARVLTAIAQARPGGVVFHCFVGKDRTGLIASLILGLLGASDETIALDYGMSDALLAERIENILARPKKPIANVGLFRAQFSAVPESILRTLTYLETHYGGVEGYLSTTELQPAVIHQLRTRLAERITESGF